MVRLWLAVKAAVRSAIARAVCFVVGHKPLTLVEKATLTSVSLVDPRSGVSLGAAMQVDAQSVTCGRCGAAQRTRPDGGVEWVR